MPQIDSYGLLKRPSAVNALENRYKQRLDDRKYPFLLPAWKNLCWEPMATKKQKTRSFEESLSELEDLSRSLESGDLSLDDSIQAYERGMELRTTCLEMLSRAEKKLEYLEKKEDGSVERSDLESEDAEEVARNLFSQSQ